MNPKDFFAHASLHHVPPRRRGFPIVILTYNRDRQSANFGYRKFCAVPISFPRMTFGAVRIAGAPHALVYLHDKPWEEIDSLEYLKLLWFNERPPASIGSICLGREFDYQNITGSAAAEHYFWTTVSPFVIYPGDELFGTEESIKKYVENSLILQSSIPHWPNGIAELRKSLVTPI